MLRYAHTISSASRRLASRHPMFCDPCTAGPRQFYPLRNNNLAVSFYDIPQPADNDIFTFDTWEFRCLRSGNIVTLKINIGGNMKAISDFIDLLTLDSKYKPFNYNIIHNYVTQQGKPMILNILANGTVKLWNMNTSISDGWICRQCITYVTNS